MIHIDRHILRNGLRVVHHADMTTQMVAVNVLYNVGARDEHPDRTGMAHLFEHLMFGGSLHVPDFDTPVQQAGGENNAWTNNDMTNFYITLPYPNVETAFWVESDRMAALNFTEQSLMVQRNVVMEEFKQRNLNKPYGDSTHLLRALAYKVHPYRWPTIGRELSHIEQVQLEQVKDFFNRYYSPSNAIVSVSGHITFADTVALAEKWFADIPSRTVGERTLPAEPPQREARMQRVSRPVPANALYMAFPMCGRLHPDYYAYDLLSDVLSNGSSSRFEQHLIKAKKCFTAIDAYITGSADPGLFVISGNVAEGVTLDEAASHVLDELETLSSSPVGANELEKVKNKYESKQVFANMNYLNVAANMAYFECIDRAEALNDEVGKIRAVTAEQLMRVAAQCFDPSHRNVLYYESESVGDWTQKVR